MSDCAGCDHPEKYGHNAYCPESRIDELKARLAEADALLTEVRDEGFDYWRDLERANRIDAHLAADGAPDERPCGCRGQCVCDVCQGVVGKTLTDQPTVRVKCNCDDHDAKYCVNRISRTVRCGCECHR